MELLTISKAAKKLGVHPNSLRNWEKQGLIKPVRLPGGQRRYSMDELNRLLQSGQLTDSQEAVVLYARVSTKKQADAGNLDRQMERLRQYARERKFNVKAELTDVASGLNQKRRGLTNVLKLAERGEYKKLIIEYPDRLARFGYSYIERHLRYCGVEIVAIAEKEPEDAQSELVRDLLAIVTSFSARLYGASGGKKVRQGFRELIAEASQSEKTEEQQEEAD
ncbi:Resolvase domain protein [Desulfotomaculum nigrificans CO-1-SRB]|uniref:Resolvase domain protein n=1 Tax=Desulfotomaculum nigrificans (strain DSM 14880 / VKM B-2319 / CO-1-SRB) TaxID=868595 RepID=F6B300_DESCC|nr:IS607 family transposase [Desulfotomaculum nigrificans]AEF93904.1 Resolvase domain protein [Desulfotomaculum nigrificans CO-1-SRB]